MSYQNGNGMDAWLEHRKSRKLTYTAQDWAELPEAAKDMVREHAPELVPALANRSRMTLDEWTELSEEEKRSFPHLSPWCATDATHPFGSWSV